jgi:2,4-dienoyl-CoA reductase-like NADH-dependent reductase (Old Yellow Enzyme family)
MMNLFSPLPLKGLTLRNRIVMAPMATNMGTPAGHPTPAQIEHYAERAQGGVGLVIVEASLVSPQPSVSTQRLGLWSDDQVGPLGALAQAIGEAGAVPAIQIVDVSLRASGGKPADMSVEEVSALIVAFVEAARRAQKAGFAAVEFHCAHSTTLADFLSRRANRRTDGYGGGVAGRARVVLEILSATRAAVGPDFPLFCRINGEEFTVNGNTLKHSVPLAQLLVEAGADVIDVSAGGRPEDGGRGSYADLRGRPAAWFPDGPNLYIPAEIKRGLAAPVVAVGKLGNPAVAEAALQAGACDLVALGRPLLADPAWAQKAEAGRWNAIKTCRCCDLCMELFNEKKAVHCVTFAEA